MESTRGDSLCYNNCDKKLSVKILIIENFFKRGVIYLLFYIYKQNRFYSKLKLE